MKKNKVEKQITQKNKYEKPAKLRHKKRVVSTCSAMQEKLVLSFARVHKYAEQKKLSFVCTVLLDR